MHPAAIGILVAALAATLVGESATQVRASTARGSNVEHFSATIHGGERFERRVLGNLRFQLVPVAYATSEGDDGWAICLHGDDSLSNYVAIATPPYHGVNASVIAAWHFRNADNTGPNRGDVNAPQEVREFQFVISAADHDRYQHALDIVLWPNGRSEAAQDSARAILDAVPVGTGRLVIRDMKLTNLGKGIVPRFETLVFEVTLEPPPGARTR
jgi:hypothetical protein